jgi:hypothetical protein
MSDDITPTTPTPDTGTSGANPNTPTSSQNAGGSLLGSNDTSGNQSSGQSSTTSAWINEKGEFTEGWLDKLPEEFKEGKQILSRFKEFPDVLKSLISAQKLLGKKADAVLIPGNDAPPEEKAEFLKKLGLPDSPDSYPTKPAELPEGFQSAEQTLENGFLDMIVHRKDLKQRIGDLLKLFGN